MSRYNFTVKEKECSKSLFDYLKNDAGVSTRLFNKLKSSNTIMINGKPSGITAHVVFNDSIEIEVADSSGDILPEFMNLDIIYEDSYLLAVNKPPHMVVHPTCYYPFRTLANGVAFHFVSQGLNLPIRPVIRLDKDTSGIVIFAKNALVQQNIIDQMSSGLVKKNYMVIVEGQPSSEEGTIDAPIARLPGSIITRYVSPEGARALTYYKTISRLDGCSLVEACPKTGRTHQLRVHFKHIGNSIIGDTLYGNESPLIGRQALHAYKYEFRHPVTGKPVSIQSPLPNDMKSIIWE